MVLAELAGVVAEVEQELGERRRAGPQVGRAAGQLRRDHARAQRVHASEEGVAPGRAALLGVVVHEPGALICDAIKIGRFAHPHTLLVAAQLHPADVVAHDEKDVWFLGRLLCGCRRAGRPSKRHHRRRAEQDSAGSLKPTRRLAWRRCNKRRLAKYGTQHSVRSPVYDASVAPRLMHRNPR